MATVAELEKTVADLKGYAEKIDEALGQSNEKIAKFEALEERVSTLEKQAEQLAGTAGEDLVELKSDTAALRRDVDTLKGGSSKKASGDTTTKRLAALEQMAGIARVPDEDTQDEAVAYGREGDKVMAYRPKDFKNPTESVVGFGDTEEEALADLEDNEEK